MKLNLIPSASFVYMVQFDLKNAIIRFIDGAVGTGKPNTLDLKIGDGTLSFDEMVPRIYTLDRGLLSGIRNGNQAPMDVTLDIIWEFLKSNTTVVITPEDALKQRGGASTWVSSDADACNPYALDVQIWYDPQCQIDEIEEIILPDFRYEKLNHDAKAGMIKVTGKCNATQATINRHAQT